MQSAHRGSVVFHSAARCVLPDSGEAPRVARRFVSASCAEWGFRPYDSEPALLTSEIVTNAIRHSVAPRRLTVSHGNAGLMLVEVSDSNRSLPVFRDPDDMDAQGGRGLWLLDKLAERWGCEATQSGKVVWFVMACEQAS